jgi:hypothetical protein
MIKEKEAALHAARGDAQYAMSQAQDLKEEMAALINERDNALAREAEAVAVLSTFRSECSSELTGQEARMLKQMQKIKDEVGPDPPLSISPSPSFSLPRLKSSRRVSFLYRCTRLITFCLKSRMASETALCCAAFFR